MTGGGKDKGGVVIIVVSTASLMKVWEFLPTLYEEGGTWQ
jgi:hypothetical protein